MLQSINILFLPLMYVFVAETMLIHFYFVTVFRQKWRRIALLLFSHLALCTGL